MGGIRLNTITHDEFEEIQDRGAALDRISRRRSREIRRSLRRTRPSYQK